MAGNGNGESIGSDWEVLDVDALHPDRWEMRSGVNYVAGHRRAQEIADRLGGVLDTNVPGAVRDVRAAVGADGTGVVWLAFDVETAERVAVLLDDWRRRLKTLGDEVA